MICTLVLPFVLTKSFSIEDYGKWSIFQSTVMWMFLMDFGVGNALQNKLSSTKKLNVRLEYMIITNIFNTILALLGVIIFWGGVSPFFNFSLSLSISFSIVILSIPFNLVGKYWISRGYSHKVEYYSFISNAMFVVVVVVSYCLGFISLAWCLIVYSLTLVAPKVFYFMKSLIPRVALLMSFHREKVIELNVSRHSLISFLKTSVSFFIAQVVFIFLLTSIRYSFAYYELYNYAAIFDIVFRPITIAIMVFILLLRPIWSDISMKFSSGNIDSCKKTIIRLFVLYILTLIFVCFLNHINVTNFLYEKWVPDVYIDDKAISATLVFGMTVILHNIVSYIMNGLSLIKEQVYYNFIGVLLCVGGFFLLSHNHQYIDFVLIYSLAFSPLCILGCGKLYKVLR
ncbi:hypothetical protein P3683_03360 [Vibrio parahaemolyticus]|nr:hypothetical protein [Vibrio parahaemolyticus]